MQISQKKLVYPTAADLISRDKFVCPYAAGHISCEISVKVGDEISRDKVVPAATDEIYREVFLC